MSFDFDIDKYLNPYIPSPHFLRHLPEPFTRFLGYREHHCGKQRRKIKDATVWAWAFVGAFCGVAAVEGVFLRSSVLREHGSPTIVASFGAAAILLYNTLDSPLAQPRNAFFGQLFSVLVGVGITKIFSLSPHFTSLYWLAAALSCASSSLIMSMTKTVHPPAGATALLATIDPSVRKLGWYYIPVVLLSSTLMIAVALLLNNIQREYPKYWWTAESLRTPGQQQQQQQSGRGNGNNDNDVESGDAAIGSSEDVDIFRAGEDVVVDSEGIRVPEWIMLDHEEKQMLQALQSRISAREKRKTSQLASNSSAASISAADDIKVGAASAAQRSVDPTTGLWQKLVGGKSKFVLGLF